MKTRNIILLIGGFALAFTLFLLITDSHNEPDKVVGFNREERHDDFDEYEYEVSTETGISYWYVQFECRDKSNDTEWRGFTIMELGTEYFDLGQVLYNCWEERQEEDYVQINFFKRVSRESFEKFQKDKE